MQIYLILIALSALIIISAEKLGLCFPCATPYITRAWCEHNDLACKKKRKRGVLTRSHVPRGVAGKGQQMSLRMTHVGVVVPRNEIVSRWWCRCARRVVSRKRNTRRLRPRGRIERSRWTCARTGTRRTISFCPCFAVSRDSWITLKQKTKSERVVIVLRRVFLYHGRANKRIEN